MRLKTHGDDILIYQCRDTVAIVEDAAGDLQHNGKHFANRVIDKALSLI